MAEHEPPADRARVVAAILAGFIGCVVAANWLTERYGFVPVGLGFQATAGTYAAGLAFGLRDALHEHSRRLVLAAIAVGAVVSWWIAPALAVASAVAFAVSELADFAVYDPLRDRAWPLAVAASNLVGAAVDTALFLWIAGFPILDAMPGQMVGKALMILPAFVIVREVRRRALPRHSVRAARA